MNPHTWTTREELRIETVIWIERTCNRRRRHGRLTPVEFELALLNSGELAA